MSKITLVVPRIIEPESALLGVTSIASYVNRPDLVRIAIAGRDSYHWPDFEPDIVAFSSWTAEMPLVRSLAAATRSAGFKGLMMLGGHHITLLPEAEEYLTEFDGFIEGEAEKNVKGLVEDSPNTLYADLREDEIPIADPAFYPRYKELGGPNRPIALLTARGCLNHCAFCATQAFGRRYRPMPIPRVFEWLELLCKRYPDRKDLVLWDDCFTNMPLTRLQEFAMYWIANSWVGRFRTISVHGGISWPIKDDVWDILRTIGVTNFNCGFESGSNRILKQLKDTDAVSVENIKANCLKAKQHKINCDGSFQFGAPGETPEDTRATLDLMKWKLEAQIPGGVWWFVTCPLPGTQMWKKARAAGKVQDNMDFGQLHLHRHEDPLLLDPSYPRDLWLRNLEEAKALMARINGRPYFKA